jgi:hypothetical protein
MGMDIDPGSLSKPFLIIIIIQDIVPEKAISTESRSPNVDINVKRNYAGI